MKQEKVRGSEIVRNAEGRTRIGKEDEKRKKKGEVSKDEEEMFRGRSVGGRKEEEEKRIKHGKVGRNEMKRC